MIDANTLLNPDYQNPELRAYAFLSTQYKAGVRSPVDCLKPFIIYAISHYAGQQLDWTTVRGYLKSKYSLNMPFYMLERMHGQLLEAGSIQTTDIHRIYLCQDARPSISGEAIDFSLDDIAQVGIALAQFAESRGMRTPATANNWSDIIIPFFLRGSQPGDGAAASVKGVIVSDPKSIDFSIVADFIMTEYGSKSTNYRTIARLYYGVLAANFLTQIESVGDKAAFKGLGIVYDTTLILRLLGFSGKVLKDATCELHETLRDLSCRTYFFSHTYEELVASIEAILKCYENNQSMFRETQEALACGEIKISDIYAIRAELDIRIAGLGISEHGARYSGRSSDDYQIDENKFKDRLERKGRWGAEGSKAAERDSMSLALILRLRDGIQVREVSKAKFIFVTHNPALANRARDFLRQEQQLDEGAVWPIMTVGQLSTISWVVNETFQDEKKITAELIADCYAAALPDQDFDEKLREVFMRTNPTQAVEIYRNAFIAQSVRQVALEQTGGHSALVKALNPAELLSAAAANREEAISNARAEERTAAESEMSERGRATRQATAARLAASLARCFMVLIFVVAVIVTVLNAGFFGRNWTHGVVVPAIAFVIAIYSLIDAAGFADAASIKGALERCFMGWIERLQHALVRER